MSEFNQTGGAAKENLFYLVPTLCLFFAAKQTFQLLEPANQAVHTNTIVPNNI